jgi:hypothetical protein
VARADLDRDVRKAEVRAKRPAPKKKAAPRGAGIVGVSTRVATRQATPKRVVQRTQKAGRPAPRGPRMPPGFDPELAAIIDEATKSAPRPKQPQREISTAGPDLSRLALLEGDGGGTIGGFLKNLGRGGVDVLTSIPASAQLAVEAAAYPVVGAVNMARGQRPGPSGRRNDLGTNIEQKLNKDLRAAGTGIKQDYAYRYGPLLEGDVGEFGSRFYDDPLPYLLDAAAGKSVVGRAPNVARRATRAVAPESRAGMRAARSLSTLSAADRVAYAAANGRQILPGPGGRYRPRRQVRSQVARDEPGLPVVGSREIDVQGSAYSGDAIARARQKLTDKARAKYGPRMEERALRRQRAAQPVGSRQQGVRERAAAVTSRPATEQAKFDRFQRRNAYDLKDLYDAKAEVDKARKIKGAGKAIAALRQDKDVVGRRIPGLSTEEAAFALHRMDMLGEVKDGKRSRGGLTAAQLRDEYVRTVGGGQRGARAGGKRTENAAAQLAAIKAVPEELLDLTDMKNPAVARVARAVEESRRVNRISQAQSQRAGVITNATRKESFSRDSAIGVGGARWAKDVIRKESVRARRRSRGLKKAIERARQNGDAPELKRLRAEYRRHVDGYKARIAAIKRDAMRDTPELQRLRATDTSKMNDSSRKRYFAQVRKAERDALGFTSPRRPELVGKRGVYVPDKRIDVTEGYTGSKPGGRFSGDRARQSKGALKSRAGQDLNPALVLHQAARASDNYTGRISAKALNELLDTAAYIDPKTGKALTGDRLKLLSQADSERVRLVHKGNLSKALKKLDELPEGRFLDDASVREVFTDKIPDGARAGDYVAISKSAADVWTESMTRIPVFDKALNLWKGALLALSPRWYVNNTFGLALQYSVMTGGDFAALVKANRMSPQIRRAMESRSPNTVKDTLADDLTGGKDIPRAIEFGFKTNAKLEEFWRRAAYYNRAKRAIRDEGGKFRKMSDAEIARAIEKMPESMIREIVRDVDFFIGNYRKFTKPEREIVKRVIPFYSWMRVIARLTFVLPFRSPLRAQAMALLETASTAGINPNDKSLPYYARGAIRVGDTAVPTWGLNPWQTMAGSIVAAGEESPSGAFAQEALGWMRPEFQFGAERATGINAFGRGVITPPGTAPFGQDPSNYNPIGAGVTRQAPRVPFKEALIQAAFPGQVQVLRKIAQGDRQAYDQVETPELVGDLLRRIGGGERNEKLYAKKRPRAGRAPTSANVYSAWFGVPIYSHNDQAVIREANKKLADYKKQLRKRENSR